MNSRWFDDPFCKAFPIAHMMRTAFPRYWLRIHSLSESKRYPETGAEREIVFDRLSQFGSALLGNHAPCLVIESRFNSYRRETELMPELPWTPVHRVVEDEHEDSVWNSCMTHTTWDPVALGTLLLAIANDQEAHIAFLSEATDCVFIPYDGGADGFSFDTALLRRLSEDFASWRSAYPHGL